VNLTLVASLALTALGSPRAEPVNVVVIMTDQHNARALGVAGNAEVRTPRLDALARQGAYFPNTFTPSPQCCPARMSILTGRYPRTHGVLFNGVLESESERTVAHALKDTGYATAAIGKMHTILPVEAFGFDLVVDRPEYFEYLRRVKGRADTAAGEWEEFEIEGKVGVSAAPNEHHKAGYWTERAIGFVRENKERPFCLWLSYYGPHTPFIPSKRWAELYEPETLTLPPNFSAKAPAAAPGLVRLQSMFRKFTLDDHKRTLGYYYGLISQIDYNIGRLLDTLDELELTQRTLVVYLSDHGEMMGEFGTWTKGSGMYDAATRVPFIVRMPGRVPAGQTRQELVELVDLVPTIHAVTGVEPQNEAQGRSLLDLFGAEAPDWRQAAVAEWGHPRRAAGVTTMVRSATHKLNQRVFRDKRTYELFDLVQDPWETANRFDDEALSEVQANLLAELERWDATTERTTPGPILQPKTRLEKRRAYEERAAESER